MLNLTDDILWDSFRQGNKEALATLFDRHADSLFRYAHKLYPDREAINDLIQDLFIEIWQQKKPKPVLSIQGYLIQSVRYKALRLLKDKRDSNLIAETTNESFTMSSEDFLIQYENEKEQILKLTKALENLSPRQREVIYLRFYLSLSYKEICTILSMEYQVARNHLHAGIKKLKELLEIDFVPSNFKS